MESETKKRKGQQAFLAAAQKGSYGTRIHVGLPKEFQSKQARQALQRFKQASTHV